MDGFKEPLMSGLDEGEIVALVFTTLQSLGWPGNASGPPWKSWRKCLWRGKCGHPCLDCCRRDPAPDKRNKMDGWIFTTLFLK